eukprot:m.358535 g.358535  ORF g.358535 m.358535 type:complete len:200 (+) comp18169_c0_seq1:257-856(+)
MGGGKLMKVVILGDGGVGKSSLMQRFVHESFNAGGYHTIGVEFMDKEVPVDGVAVKLQIWDTAGQERFKALRTPFYRGSDCCMLTFDLTDQVTFNNLDHWRSEFLHYADVSSPETFPFIVVGNKADVDGRVVAKEDAEAWCHKAGGVPYVETSAKTAQNVESAFVEAARLLLKREAAMPKTDYTESVNLKNQPSSSGCC